MDIFLDKSPCRVTARISTKAKDSIVKFSEKRGINESQYVKLAIQNQIKADETDQTPKP